MHDVQLFFIKDSVYIPAHKIVLSTVSRLSEYIEARSQDKLTGELPTIEFSSEYDSGTFGKVLKLLYLGPSKIHDINLLEGRAMYRVAWKIGAKNVQRYLIVHWLIPKLSIDQCLFVLEDAFNRLSQTTVDDIVKLLFEVAQIYWARRLSLLLNSQIRVLHGLNKNLLKTLIGKSLYFATDEHDLLNFIKLLLEKESTDFYEFLSTLSIPYRRAVAYNYKYIDISPIINELGSAPMKYSYISNEKDSKAKRFTFGVDHTQISNPKNLEFSFKKSKVKHSSEFEKQSPLENRISMNHEINSKDFNHDLILKISPDDFSKDGVTFFSDCFYSFSATWNLMIDILPSGSVDVYIVEREYRKPQNLAEWNNMAVFNSSDISTKPNIRSKDLINDGRNATFLINFKSVLFSVSLVDSRLSKEFKIFYSFCKGQNQAIGWK